MSTEIATDVIRIQLANGKGSTIIDADFVPPSMKWYITRGPRTAYAQRTDYTNGKRRGVLLHREVMAEILGRPLEPGEEVDHINGNGLDNRRSNLRLATRSENGRNSRTRSDNTSGFKGVFWDKAAQKWRARIVVDGRRLYLGYYTDLVAAARMYDAAALAYHGAFASTNFPTATCEHKGDE